MCPPLFPVLTRTFPTTAHGCLVHPRGRVYVPQSHRSNLCREVEQQPLGQICQLRQAQARQGRLQGSPLCYCPLRRNCTLFFLKKLLHPFAKGNVSSNHWMSFLQVPYNITGWLEKNKDPLNDTVVDQFKKGNNKLVQEIFADHPGQSGGKEEAKGTSICSFWDRSVDFSFICWSIEKSERNQRWRYHKEEIF